MKPSRFKIYFEPWSCDMNTFRGMFTSGLACVDNKVNKRIDDLGQTPPAKMVLTEN